MDCSTPSFPVLHHLLEFAQTHVHWSCDAVQPSHPLLSPSPPAFSLSQLQGIFQGVSSSHQMAKALEFQLQHQSFQSVSSVQSLSHVRLFVTPWTAARQVSLSITNSWSLLKLMSIESVIPTISSSVIPNSSSLQSFPASGSFQMSQLFASGGQSIGLASN